MRVVATAGHVDHGKSTVVRSLTGTDPDRWAEEQRRGLTIDLGFAAATLPSGAEVGLVDVPGHERFIRNLLAGVGAVDACLMVVSAAEGWMPQSEEHLRILELLGVTSGLVALTRVDGAGPDTVDAARLEVAEAVAGTFLEGAAVVGVDLPSGIGRAELVEALDRLVVGLPGAADRGRPRLWVDRSFPIRGAGTVVTGTLTGGGIAIGDQLEVAPGGRTVRVRGLQSHHRNLEAAGPGRRLAVNLSGSAHHELGRGDALIRAGQWHAARAVDVELRAVPGRALRARGAWMLHTGTAARTCRWTVLGGGRDVPEGGSAPARVWLDGPGLPLVPGDRFVLRDLGRGETAGGGTVLDVEPVLPPRRARPDASPARVVAERGWVAADELERLTGRPATPTHGRWVVDPAAAEAIRSRLASAASAAGASGVDLAALDEVERAVVAGGVPGVEVVAGRAVAAGAGRAPGPDATRVLALLDAEPLHPPELPVGDRGALRELERLGLARQAGELWFGRRAVEDATTIVRRVLAGRPDGATAAELRTALGTSRKYALPLLGLLDADGVTRRVGDRRVARHLTEVPLP